MRIQEKEVSLRLQIYHRFNSQAMWIISAFEMHRFAKVFVMNVRESFHFFGQFGKPVKNSSSQQWPVNKNQQKIAFFWVKYTTKEKDTSFLPLSVWSIRMIFNRGYWITIWPKMCASVAVNAVGRLLCRPTHPEHNSKKKERNRNNFVLYHMCEFLPIQQNYVKRVVSPN